MNPVFDITSSVSIMPRPQGGEQLSAGIKQLREAGFCTLVSLITSKEAAMLGLEREKEECESLGMEFIHFPIEDFGVPENTEEMLDLADRLLLKIREGKRIIIHCRGGIGRSSLLACALLVLQGFSCSDATVLAGRSRGCKVPETPGQEQWLEKFHTTISARNASLNT